MKRMSILQWPKAVFDYEITTKKGGTKKCATLSITKFNLLFHYLNCLNTAVSLDVFLNEDSGFRNCV